jgi:alanine racemase
LLPKQSSSLITRASKITANDAEPLSSVAPPPPDTVPPDRTRACRDCSVTPKIENGGNEKSNCGAGPALAAIVTMPQRKMLAHPSSTLGNVSGQDLAREVRAILMTQKAASEAAEQEQEFNETAAAGTTSRASPVALYSAANSTDISIASSTGSQSNTTVPPSLLSQRQILSENPKPPPMPAASAPPRPFFGGIEAVARSSRTREIARAKVTEVFQEDDSDQLQSMMASASTSAESPSVPVSVVPAGIASISFNRKRLQWHASVDSGMGRLGFKTEPVRRGDMTGRRDAVDILKELTNAEIHGNAPIEFFGMCTHMAEANSTSMYTQSQIDKFVALLQRVRQAGIFVPTVSTDNSAALLTTSLTHFDPKAILSQPGADTRGFVRIGGAIFGQRPAFEQLKSPSTLIASVRHVAILQKGESVGYDRAYVAPYDVRIATLTIGFADGYPRELGNGVGKVSIRGAVFPIAGNVCMDMCMVELGPAEDRDGAGAQVVVGDTAALWGPVEDDEDAGLVRLQDLAATLNTTQSALTCGLDNVRVSRLYI